MEKTINRLKKFIHEQNRDGHYFAAWVLENQPKFSDEFKTQAQKISYIENHMTSILEMFVRKHQVGPQVEYTDFIVDFVDMIETTQFPIKIEEPAKKQTKMQIKDRKIAEKTAQMNDSNQTYHIKNLNTLYNAHSRPQNTHHHRQNTYKYHHSGNLKNKDYTQKEHSHKDHRHKEYKEHSRIEHNQNRQRVTNQQMLSYLRLPSNYVSKINTNKLENRMFYNRLKAAECFNYPEKRRQFLSQIREQLSLAQKCE